MKEIRAYRQTHPETKPMKKIAVSTISLFLLASPTWATWKPEYASAPQEVQDWYRNAELTPEAQKRFFFVKCCAQSETVRTKFSVNRTNGKDQWSYLLPDGKWKIIPPDIVHENEPTPDGQPVLFVLGNGQETCFFPGDGGI